MRITQEGTLIMGKLSTALRGATLSQQHRAQVVALDAEFTQLELENETLKMQKRTLEAEVNPAKREVQRLKEQIERDRVKPHDDLLDKAAEQILLTVANNRDLSKEEIILSLNVSTARGDYLFDQLKARKFATIGHANDEGVYWHATPEGRKYLADHDLL